MVTLFISHMHLLRESLVAALRSGEGNQPVSAWSRETVEAAVAEHAPGVVVVDASHPEAMDLVLAVRAAHPKASVVVLTMHEADEEFLAWADIGISGYLGPDTSTFDLLSAVRRAGVGDVFCPPRLTALLMNRFADRSNERTSRAGIFALTSREREIAELLAAGMSNKLIARRLQVAVPTVKNHVHSILEKWDVRSRGEAAAVFRDRVRGSGESGGALVRLRGGSAPVVASAARQSGVSPYAGRRAA